MADGLTVPFALAAGLAGAIDSSSIIVTAGLAEIAAGSIAMGLGGYLGAKSEAEHFANERRREEIEVRDLPEVEAAEVHEIFVDYGISDKDADTVVDSLRSRPDAWVDFMMRFELGLEEPDPKRALQSAIAIGGAYIVGGLIPLVPYMLAESITSALAISAVATICALFVFGYIKARFTGARALKSAFQTVLIGGIAAGVAFMVARLIS